MECIYEEVFELVCFVVVVGKRRGGRARAACESGRDTGMVA